MHTAVHFEESVLDVVGLDEGGREEEEEIKSGEVTKVMVEGSRKCLVSVLLLPPSFP